MPGGSELQVIVQHHPGRAELLTPLLESLLPLPVEVSTHQSDPPSPWAGYQQALSRFPSNAKHVILLQDDVRVCRNFPLAVKKIAEAKPDTPVALFLGGLPKQTAANALRAAKRGEHYVPIYFRDFVPVVAVLWPKAKAVEFLEWSKTAKLPGQPNPRSDDAVVGRWMLTTKQLVLATIPSLVQHPDESSIIHPKRAKSGLDKGRVALMFEDDPSGIDWSN